jgi:uncharacterized membrane protein
LRNLPLQNEATARTRAGEQHAPTVGPPTPESLNSALFRNIETLQRRQQEEARRAGIQDKVAHAITRFTGSYMFVYLHLAWIGFWVIANLSWVPGVHPWDDSFVVLAMIASVEAIFLSTFVLITQNQMAAANDQRDALNLQISLLAEHEVTKLIDLVSSVALHLGVSPKEEIGELTRDVAPEAVLDALKDTKC